MPDEAEVSGVVVGDPGAVIAGWVKIGEHGIRRIVTAPVTIRTDDGSELTLRDVTNATLGPIARRTAEWQELERDPLAALCVAEAPAPDVEVELFTAAVRGGDRIAAWGSVVERAFDGSGSSADGAFRTAAASRVSVLTPAFVAIGENAASELARLRAEPAKEPSRPPAARAEPVKEAAPEKKKKKRQPKPPTGIYDRLARPIVPWLTLAWIAVCGVVGILVPGAREIALVVAGTGSLFPLAYDTFVLPPFKSIPVGPRKPHAPSAIGFFIVGGMTVMCAVWYGADSSSSSASKRAGAPLFRIGALIGGGLGIGVAGWCFVATRPRRRMTSLLARAAAHPRPLVDGVWGATDGRLEIGKAGAPRVNEVPHAVVDGEHIRGTGSRNSKGVWSGSETTNLQGAVSELTVIHTGGRTKVDTYGGWWWSALRYDRSTPDFRLTDRVDVIPDGAQVRVVGRASGGVLAKGGPESLLVFACPAERDVVDAVQALRRREQLALGFAGGGAAAIVAGITLAFVA